MRALDQHPLAERFRGLTPEHVIDAVEVGGRRCSGRFIILNSYENRVYQLEVEPDDARSSARAEYVVGKFYRPGRWSPEAIADEHRLLAELAEQEIPVVPPLALDESGRTLGEIAGGIYYSIFPRVGGRAPQELRDDQIQVLGRLLARTHNVCALGEAPHRPPLSPATYGRENLAWLLAEGAIHPDARATYRATVEALLDRIGPLFQGVPVHRIHGDCHLGNLLWTDDGPTLLDFDDLRVGPAVQDIWLLAGSFDREGDRQRDLLLEAYRQFRDFDDAWLKLVEPLRALRFVHYATWIARRWADPIFPRFFGHFGTLQYWQRETIDLREQIARIDQAVYDRQLY